MGSLWRSEHMTLCQLFIPEGAYECVNALGELGLVQFQDLNEEKDTDGDKNDEGVPAFRRKYTNEVRRCDEMARKLRYFEKEIVKHNIRIDGPGNAVNVPAPDSGEMQQMEAEFERLERELNDMNQNAEALIKQEAELTEMRHILTKTGQFFDQADLATQATEGGQKEPLMAASDGRGKLGFIAGTIPRDKAGPFERLMWRACRGNVFMRRVQLDELLMDSFKGEKVKKDVFIVFYQGSQLETRVRKICEGFQTTQYPCPDNNVERRQMCVEVDTRMADLTNVLNTTHEHLLKNLDRTASHLAAWQVKVTKIKAIYHTMNKFNEKKVGECWCPTEELGTIRTALKVGAERSGTGATPILTPVKTKRAPPTYHVTNRFTYAFQAIVDAYGVACYQEVNPGPFTIITFPFLFAVMFGDLGHGFLMFLFAYYLVHKEQTLANLKGGGEIWDTIFGGRYIVLLMGCFSMYTGFIYNDVFAKSMTIVPSGWRLPLVENVNSTESFKMSHLRWDTANQTAYNNSRLTFEEEVCDKVGCFEYAYPFGMDPMWRSSDNELTFTNSFKMKLSVILGVMQMGFGVILSWFNGKFNKEPLDYIHVFIPQAVFLFFIFGYLCVMIVYKWCMSSFPNGNPPSLLLMLINMFLKMGSTIDEGEVLYGDKEGKAQLYIQTFLVACALICVPWMLLYKPLALKKRIAAHEAQKAIVGHNDDEPDDGEDEHHDFSEIMVHQAIHTIEFCLGCISNTASYLRLWALSLAHAQLSEVLWEMILQKCFQLNFFVCFCGFSIWAVLTIAVLLIMEGLSAFLHALRLHWVEFQNKFYTGTGYLFEPFSFHLILESEEEF